MGSRSSSLASLVDRNDIDMAVSKMENMFAVKHKRLNADLVQKRGKRKRSKSKLAKPQLSVEYPEQPIVESTQPTPANQETLDD